MTYCCKLIKLSCSTPFKMYFLSKMAVILNGLTHHRLVAFTVRIRIKNVGHPTTMATSVIPTSRSMTWTVLLIASMVTWRAGMSVNTGLWLTHPSWSTKMFLKLTILGCTLMYTKTDWGKWMGIFWYEIRWQKDSMMTLKSMYLTLTLTMQYSFQSVQIFFSVLILHTKP